MFYATLNRTHLIRQTCTRRARRACASWSCRACSSRTAATCTAAAGSEPRSPDVRWQTGSAVRLEFFLFFFKKMTYLELSHKQIKHSDWLKLVRWLTTSNQSFISEYHSYATLKCVLDICLIGNWLERIIWSSQPRFNPHLLQNHFSLTKRHCDKMLKLKLSHFPKSCPKRRHSSF